MAPCCLQWSNIHTYILWKLASLGQKLSMCIWGEMHVYRKEATHNTHLGIQNLPTVTHHACSTHIDPTNKLTAWCCTTDNRAHTLVNLHEVNEALLMELWLPVDILKTLVFESHKFDKCKQRIICVSQTHCWWLTQILNYRQSNHSSCQIWQFFWCFIHRQQRTPKTIIINSSQ